ncbi:histidine kinase [Melaminivora suipulveris]|uniref:Virulence sensor protein BvgS n=1 Tax=Melaminivora suipulveris TaxID=2109913 RepID=A0A2R3QGQ9_9BURK|nr:histidine kinase [Melaminivora suipulveris]
MPARTLTGLALAALAAMLIAVLTWRSSDDRAEVVAEMNTTVDAIAQVQLVWAYVKNAESALRGYLLTNDEALLSTYTVAQAALPLELEKLQRFTRGSLVRKQRTDQLQSLINKEMLELERVLQLQRKGQRDEAVAIVRSDARVVMESTRNAVRDLLTDQREDLQERRGAWENAFGTASYLVWGSTAVLLLLICGWGWLAITEHRARERESWVKTGLVGMGARAQGEQRMHELAPAILEYLAYWLDGRVGAMYVTQGHGTYERVGGFALMPDAPVTVVHPGEGLLGQALQTRRLMQVRDVPPGYLPVSSGTGQAAPVELVILPLVLGGVTLAVIELGLFTPLGAEGLEFLRRADEQLAQAVRAALDRLRLQSLLDETQRQSEELQAQQEELRVNNEELEQQSRALQESQTQLLAQQTSLEETNAQLEEQAQELEYQKEQLLRTQDTLQAQAAELAQASQYKSEFLANMSHELRTPLNSSLILSKLLADNKGGNLTPDQVRYAQTIHSAGNDLLALINDILDLAKIESGQTRMDIDDVSLARLVHQVIEPLKPMAQEKGLLLEVDIEPGVPERIQSDEQRIAQILKNLLFNALKFTERGEVRLRVCVGAVGTVSLAVRDTGIGIAEGQQEQMFEAFRQADGSMHRKYGGTGLGLSISRNLAQLLGGDISVQSTLGEGSVFTLTLPVVAPAAPLPVVAPLPGPTPAAFHAEYRRNAPVAAPAAADSPDAPAEMPDDDRARIEPGRRLILVIEDDPHFARILFDLVHEMDFQCITCASGREGLELAQRHLPSGVLLDMNLPDYSGLGVLDQLKHDPATRHIPVHVISGADYSQKALEQGAVGYALKPVQRDELVLALERMQAKFTDGMRRLLVVEDDERQRESVCALLAADGVQIDGAATAQQALALLRSGTFDCMVMDLNLPDLSGYELLRQMAEEEGLPFPPVIVYTGRSLSRQEEQELRRYSKSIIIKDVRSPERLLDEVTLFLHKVESSLPADHQRLLQRARDREEAFDGRTILVVEDDVRNIFALSSVLEPTGARVQIARNGREALEQLAAAGSDGQPPVDLVLMDIMMPEMDGLTAMREIRKRPEWRRLPIIALTAKAMKDDQEKCLAAGASDYIAKPLDVEKLLSLVRVWMPK